MKLKKILENLDKMPSTLKGFNQTPKLSGEQKSKLMDMVNNYNRLGEKLRLEQSLVETATALSEIAELAETYACNEAQDWFATEVVKKDFKRAKNISVDFQKIAKECHGRIQQLNALYEDMGHILGRYYEIADPMAEVMPNPANIKSQRGLPNASPVSVNPQDGSEASLMEVKPNTSNLQSQRKLPANGSLKEVAVDDKNKNIKSQRELPQGGPAPAQVKEVAVDGMNKNIKSQRDLPSGGPSTPQVKETTLNHPPYQTCKHPGCGKPVQRTLSAEFCPQHANPKSVNVKEVTHNDKNIKSQRDLPSGGPAPAQVKEVAVDDKNKNIKSQRDLPAGGPTPYNPPKDPKDTGSVKETAVSEVNHNDKNIKSQRDLPHGGPTPYKNPTPQNPSVPTKAAVGESFKFPSLKEILGIE